MKPAIATRLGSGLTHSLCPERERENRSELRRARDFFSTRVQIRGLHLHPTSGSLLLGARTPPCDQDLSPRASGLAALPLWQRGLQVMVMHPFSASAGAVLQDPAERYRKRT
jgi:hypothetical protein